MINQEVILERNISDYSQPSTSTADDLQRQQFVKDQLNLYYDDYYVKTKKAGKSKAKRSYSKKAGGRCEFPLNYIPSVYS